jgi:Flp pilus assembly pilin Flp
MDDVSTPGGTPRARGQGLLEYALIIGLVALVVIAALVFLGPQIRDMLFNANNNL